MLGKNVKKSYARASIAIFLEDTPKSTAKV
jgi:hypothetical protein